MEKMKHYQGAAMRLLKALLAAYIVTGGLLLLLALLLYKLRLSESVINLSTVSYTHLGIDHSEIYGCFCVFSSLRQNLRNIFQKTLVNRGNFVFAHILPSLQHLFIRPIAWTIRYNFQNIIHRAVHTNACNYKNSL